MKKPPYICCEKGEIQTEGGNETERRKARRKVEEREGKPETESRNGGEKEENGVSPLVPF